MQIPTRLVAIAALALLAAPLAAQSPSTLPHEADDADDAAESPARITGGIIAGATHLVSGRDERALSGTVHVKLASWASVAVNPTFATVVDTGRLRTTQSGLADLPLELSLGRDLPVAWSPSIGVGMSVTLPAGDSAKGFGSGRVGYGANVGLGLAPTPRLSAYLGAGRSLSGPAGQSSLDATGTWGDAELGYHLSERVRVSGGVNGDIGAPAAGAQRATSVGGGLAFNVVGPSNVTITAGHRVSGDAPSWSITVGFGTESAEINHVAAGMISPLRKLGGAFGAGSSAGHGAGLGHKP